MSMREHEWDALALALGGSILKSLSSSTANVSDPKVNWVPRGNFMSKVQGVMVFPDGS
jgi:hypothetical protein